MNFCGKNSSIRLQVFGMLIEISFAKLGCRNVFFIFFFANWLIWNCLNSNAFKLKNAWIDFEIDYVFLDSVYFMHSCMASVIQKHTCKSQRLKCLFALRCISCRHCCCSMQCYNTKWSPNRMWIYTLSLVFFFSHLNRTYRTDDIHQNAWH